jgi:outer membrane protein assembly factor BamB
MENEFVQALSTQDGKVLWTTRVGTLVTRSGPSCPSRSTPTVDGTFSRTGSDGDLVCLETRDGKVRWQKSLRKEFEGQPHDWA